MPSPLAHLASGSPGALLTGALKDRSHVAQALVEVGLAGSVLAPDLVQLRQQAEFVQVDLALRDDVDGVLVVGP